MPDTEKIERVMLLIEMWYYLEKRGLVWPAVKKFIEKRINEELGEDAHE